MVNRQTAISQSFKDLSEKFSLVKSHDVKFGTAKAILSKVGFTPERQAFWKYEITRDNTDLASQYDADGHGTMKHDALYLLYRVLYCEREYGDKFMLVHDGRWSDNFKSASQINKMLTHPYKNAGGVINFLKKHGCLPAAVIIDVTSSSKWPMNLYNTEDAINALKEEGMAVGLLLDHNQRYVPGSGLFTIDNFGPNSIAKAWLGSKKPVLEMNGVKYYSRSVFNAWNTKRKITPLRGMPDLITTMHERDLFLDILSAREQELDDALIQCDKYAQMYREQGQQIKKKVDKQYRDKFMKLQLDLNKSQSAVRKHKQTIEELSTELETIKGLLGLG